MEEDNLPPSRCKTEANKFVFNRYKLLELLHGNKLVRTESDNTAAAAASLRPRMVWLAGSGLVVIVIRIHVEQTCEWQPCFSYPIPHSCFRPQRTQANAAFDDDRKELWMLRFQRLQQTQSRAEHQSIRSSVCNNYRHISIKTRIPRRNQRPQRMRWKWKMVPKRICCGFCAEPKIINCYWIPSFHPQSLKGNSPYYNASGTLVTTLLILITTLGLMIQSRLKIINTSKLKF